MDISIKSTLASACRALLRPIASVLMNAGMTWREFGELSKGIFVSVASDEFGIGGRPTNISRVSILTGISRKEVKRQRELLSEAKPVESRKTTDATRLLSHWHQDPEFMGPGGEPLPLPITGSAPSFAALFERFGGDTPEQTLLKELIRGGSVEKTASGHLIAKRRYHMPTNLDAGLLRFFGTNLFDHAETLRNNISPDGAEKRFEGFAVDDRIDPAFVDEFNDYVEERGQQFLEEIDEWLNAHRLDTNSQSSSPVRLGLGVYAINGPLPKGTLS